jgi:hypothetical protein
MRDGASVARSVKRQRALAVDVTAVSGNRPRLSVNDMIRSHQQRWWDREPERAGRFQIDDELELRGLLDREIAGVRAPENLIDVRCSASRDVGEASRSRER